MSWGKVAVILWYFPSTIWTGWGERRWCLLTSNLSERAFKYTHTQTQDFIFVRGAWGMPHLSLKIPRGSGWLTGHRWQPRGDARCGHFLLQRHQRDHWLGQEQGPVGDWKRGVTLVKGTIGGAHSGGHSGENCFGAFKESHQWKRILPFPETPAKPQECQCLRTWTCRVQPLWPLTTLCHPSSYSGGARNASWKKKWAGLWNGEGTTMPLLSREDSSLKEAHIGGRKSFNDVLSSDDGLWLGIFTMKWEFLVAKSDWTFKSSNSVWKLRRFDAGASREVALRRVSRDFMILSVPQIIAVAFSYCGKRYSKFTILTSFNCTVQWH